jgi:DNA-binding NarL/FixJ family response regulator
LPTFSVLSISGSTIAWDRLSERRQAILRLIVIPTSNGYSILEVARELGTTRRWVSDRVDELRDEIERLALPR